MISHDIPALTPVPCALRPEQSHFAPINILSHLIFFSPVASLSTESQMNFGFPTI